MEIKESLTFDDLLLVPQYSEVASRADVDLSVNIRDYTFSHPIVVANMASLMNYEMAYQIGKSGGLALMHRFTYIEEQINVITRMGFQSFPYHLGVSIGIKEEDKQNVKQFFDIGVDIFCLDIAHANSKRAVEMTQYLRETYPNIFLIAGNVATGDGARRLWEAGADMVKVGIGGGSLCSTRIETGNGVPTMTAIMDVYQTKQQLLARDQTRLPQNRRQYGMIADGGIRNAGDCVKSLCFSDMVMVGNLFAGCQETPGKIHTIDNQQYKSYVGSSTHKSNRIEGVESWVKVKGTYQSILTKLQEGIASGCSYQGVNNLVDLKENPIFTRITHAGLIESHPHSVQIRGQ